MRPVTDEIPTGFFELTGCDSHMADFSMLAK